MPKRQRTSPLKRDGTHQTRRWLPALAADYFQPDERQTADLVSFAERYMRHLRYYDENNQSHGNWSPFFSTDVSAVLAALSLLPVGSFRNFAGNLTTFLTAVPDRSANQLAAHFKLALYLPLLLLEDVAEQCGRLPAGHGMSEFTEHVFRRDVQPALSRTISYYKGALALAEPPLSDMAVFDDAPPDPSNYNTTFADDERIQLPSVVSRRLVGARKVAQLKMEGPAMASFGASWQGFHDSIAPDTRPYEDSIGAGPQQTFRQIHDALTYNLLIQSLNSLFQAAERIAAEAALYLERSLRAFDQHTPHYGLWLAFLRLFRLQQRDLNGLTIRHLDYYYREVLGMLPRGARPDHVHLIVTPGKGVAEHLLPAATTYFRAGKDATGREVVYRLDRDFVVNRARIVALKSMRFSTMKSPTGQPVAVPLATKVTNSSDGRGAPLAQEDPRFPPFGPAPADAAARIGFAVADRQLFTREGTRMIGVLAQAPVTESKMLPPSVFRIWLTTEEGWLEVASPSKRTAGILQEEGIFVIVQLDGDDPAVTPYDESVHRERLGVSVPVMKVELDFSQSPSETASLFAWLRDFQFHELTVCSRAGGIRRLTIQNDSGEVDPAKPFLPFGPSPRNGASLVIGNNEVFSKRLRELTVSLTWEEAITASSFFKKHQPGDHRVGMQHLVAGSWQSFSSPEPALFGRGTRQNITVSGVSALSTAAEQSAENTPFSSRSASGFIRLVLRDDFGHAEFPGEHTKALIKLAGGATSWSPNTAAYNYDFQFAPAKLSVAHVAAELPSVVPPVIATSGTPITPLEPYTPKLMDITLSYESDATPPEALFHLHPFGHVRVATAEGRLIPQFDHEGELYLGVDGLAAPQRLSMLIQTADGSANPLKNETELKWSYLEGDRWTELPARDVEDGTGNFTASGIVSIALPRQADTDHRILPAGLHWLRVAAVSDTDAVNDLRSVDAQAVAASFVDNGNDPKFLATPLPAGTISKLKAGDAAIKTIRQPYESFGGNPPESSAAFHVRAAERLRHKDRAATAWDFEHLVLERFPHIYKVKCINHTRPRREQDDHVVGDNEVRPGHVLIVPVPDIKSRHLADPLRPYTDKATLAAIGHYLRRRISPHVTLAVQNPKFEEVRVKFAVAFTPDVADHGFFLKTLNDAIVRFLSPWAYDQGVDISFGGRWHKSSIIQFVEEQPYVDYVKVFEMHHKVDIHQSDASFAWKDVEVVSATTSRSILVSHRSHAITRVS